MQRGITGRDFEERLRTKLGTWCMIQHDQVLDHEYKIDFAILAFKDVPRFTPQIGIQVTVKDDDIGKQAQFLSLHNAGQVIPKSVFLEVDSSANLDGAAVIACFALGAFAFNELYKPLTAVGLRIARDLSFEFFDIAENIQRLKQTKAAVSRTVQLDGQVSTTTAQLTGQIRRFNREKGFGFIECAERPEENVYLHISKTHPELERELASRVGTLGLGGWLYFQQPITVVFEDGGYKAGQKYPQAIDVHLAAEVEPAAASQQK